MPQTRSFKLIAPNDRPPTEVGELDKAIKRRNNASIKARREFLSKNPQPSPGWFKMNIPKDDEGVLARACRIALDYQAWNRRSEQESRPRKRKRSPKR
jgi:hypothetical protein